MILLPWMIWYQVIWERGHWLVLDEAGAVYRVQLAPPPEAPQVV